MTGLVEVHAAARRTRAAGTACVAIDVDLDPGTETPEIAPWSERITGVIDFDTERAWLGGGRNDADSVSVYDGNRSYRRLGGQWVHSRGKDGTYGEGNPLGYLVVLEHGSTAAERDDDSFTVDLDPVRTREHLALARTWSPSTSTVNLDDYGNVGRIRFEFEDSEHRRVYMRITVEFADLGHGPVDIQPPADSTSSAEWLRGQGVDLNELHIDH